MLHLSNPVFSMTNNKFDISYWANRNQKALTPDAQNENNNSRKASQQPSASWAQRDSAWQDVQLLVEETVRSGIDLTAGYHNWLSIAFALAYELGENGRELFHQLSRMNADYNEAECDRKYTNCLQKADGRTRIGTLFYMADKAGIRLKQAVQQKAENPKDTHSFAQFAQFAQPAQPCAKEEQKDEKDSIITFNNDNNIMNINNIDNNKQYNLMPEEFVNAQGCASAQTAQTAQKVQPAPTAPETPQQPLGISSASTFADKINNPNQLRILARILESNPNAQDADKMIIGFLTLISPLVPKNIYGLYGGLVVYPCIYAIIYGSAASKKGELKILTHLLDAYRAELTAAYHQQMAEYEEQHTIWEAMGGKASERASRGPEPKEPKYTNPLIAVDSSVSAVMRLLDANGGWGTIFETEADALTRMFKNDITNYSALMRNAFHHEPLNMNRVTDNLHIDIQEPRLSVLLSCTPGQLPSLFTDFENGLGSRFLFYELNQKVEWRDPFAFTQPIDLMYKEMGKELLELIHELERLGERRIQFLLAKEQIECFNQFFSEMLREQNSIMGESVSSFIFRLGLYCFRIAMVLSLLRRFEEWTLDRSKPLYDPNEQAFTCRDDDFQTALTIVNCLVNHSLRIFSALNRDNDNPLHPALGTMSSQEQLIYQALPQAFTTEEFRQTAVKCGLNPDSARRYLSNFCNKYKVVQRVSNGHYRKVEKQAQNAN